MLFDLALLRRSGPSTAAAIIKGCFDLWETNHIQTSWITEAENWLHVAEMAMVEHAIGPEQQVDIPLTERDDARDNA